MNTITNLTITNEGTAQASFADEGRVLTLAVDSETVQDLKARILKLRGMQLAEQQAQEAAKAQAESEEQR